MATAGLSTLFNPRSVAIIGASDKNPWSAFVMRTLAALQFGGAIHLVNKRGGEALGRPTVASASEIGEPVDAAFVVVPADAMEETLTDMAAAGIRNGVVVTSGFAETGPAGAADQNRLFALARDLDMRLLGPNSLGFNNYVAGIGLSALPTPTPLLPNPRVGLVSQSGATCGILTKAAHGHNVSLSYAVAVGNEAMIDTAEVIDFLIDDPSTRSIAIFAEAIRDPSLFLDAARRALAARKPLVMLKVGVGELAAQVAQAHTGALVGDNRIFDAVCRDFGIIRVDTIEQLMHTAGFLAHTGVLPEGKFGVVSISGGACEMIADLGDAAGVPFARFSRETVEKLTRILPSYATAQNPLDVTGAALADFTMFEEAIVSVAEDREVALVGAVFEVPQQEADVSPVSRSGLTHIANGFARSAVPGFVLPQPYTGVTEFGRRFEQVTGLPYVASGLGHAMKSVGAAFTWSARARAGLPPAPAPVSVDGAMPTTERAALDYLAQKGVPVIPATIVRSAGEAIEAAARLGEPVALKILSPDIQHKTDVGGVLLDLHGDEVVAEGYQRIIENVRTARPEALIEGVIVSPMRRGGVELFVGIARDPAWGLAAAIGLGGVWVELLADVSLRLLPVTPEQVLNALDSLKAKQLLQGYRGATPINRQRVAEVIAGIGDAALALGPDLMSLEINPLFVSGDRVECLDALVVWNRGTGHE